MTTDLLSNPTATVAGLFVAGLGAVFAYTQLGPLLDTVKDKDTHTRTGADTEARNDGEKRAASISGPMARKGRKKKKGKGVREGAGEGAGKDRANGKDQDKGDLQDGAAVVVPGDFEAVGVGAKMDDADGGSRDAASVGAVSKPGNSGKTKKQRKKKNQSKVQGGDEIRDKGKDNGGEEAEEVGSEGSETGKEGGVGRTAARGVPRHSGESTDADASSSLSPSVSTSTSAFSRTVGKGNLRASTRVAPPSQPYGQARGRAPSPPRAIRPSLSFDTDSSWTHVDHRRLKMSNSVDGQSERLADAADVTSSDLASTESSSPVAERTEGVTDAIRSTRADLTQRTLADKLAPRSEETGVEDMLEQPDFRTLARVMRVQPRADETPVPGFSWEDYGDVEDSLLVHDADQEDEGEWGIVKSRNRTRTPQTTTTTASTSQAAAAPETMTKKQRQNARKRELAKSIKADTEVARLEGLAKHKRELERLRIIEQSQQGGGKRASGGMHATVDDLGKLVWE